MGMSTLFPNNTLPKNEPLQEAAFILDAGFSLETRDYSLPYYQAKELAAELIKADLKFNDQVACITTATAEIEALKAHIAEIEAGERMLLERVRAEIQRAYTASERASKYGIALDAIRHEVMQYPMDAPAGELVDMLDRMTRQG